MNEEVLQQMVLNGMDCARINLSHVKREDIENIINLIRVTRINTGVPIAIMYDTKGPEFRTLEFENNGISIKTGETIKMVKKNVIGNKEAFSVNHPEAIDYIDVGSHVLIDNALLNLEVIDKQNDHIILKALNDGEICRHKTINVPGIDLNLTSISEVDKDDIAFATTHSCDYLALSFVNNKEDVLTARKLIQESGGEAMIISKIENKTGIDNIDEIISVSDGIMIARGDLGVEIPMESLPVVQKEIITKCREQGKFAIVATEMLASM
jgi:pyruvate kinase